MAEKRSRPLFLFYILVAYVLVQFGWWSYLMIQQNYEIYHLKSEINLLHHEDPQLVIEKGNELEHTLMLRRMMIAGEGMVFLVLLIIAFLRVRSTFKKESSLAEQQKNFLLSVTHELKSPIASARLALETLVRRDLDREKQKEILLNAIGDTDRLNTLVENILLAARIENAGFEVHKENVNLSEYLDDVIRQAFASNPPLQRLTTDIQPNIFFDIDKNIFPSILLNLLGNACKYSPSGSTIKVALHEQGNGIILSVADEGSGIPDSEKENIFKKFYRIGSEETRKTKGTGLGLYIVKYLAEKHGARISVRDNKPKGTIFETIFIK